VASENVGLRTFFYVFQNPRKHGVLRFFELLHTFSRTLTQKNGDGQERYDTIRYEMLFKRALESRHESAYSTARNR